MIHNGTSTQEEIEKYNTINLIRRRTNISDLAYANACIKPWDYFVTLTFDDTPEMRYLIIPELHKSGRIHFHGVFSDLKN